MAAGPDSLLGELPDVDNELIPLAHLVERVTAQAYNDLAGLAETLPSHPDLERKRHVVDYVLQTRRQLLKLLVLVRWSGTAQGVLKSRNIIGFLARQNWEFENSINELTATKAILAGARVRNSDLPTALSVLTHGTYTRLPSTLTDAFRLPPTLPDDLALRTLTELDELLRWRLGALDRVPLPLARHGWTIADGRVRFRIPGLWEATLTYSGDEGDAQGEWYLLTVEFLFRVRDARGVWAGVPVGAMKEHIVELANRELAWRRVHADAADRPGAVVVGDAPLERGYAFLQRLALRYQLEAVYGQAARLAGTAWAGHLKVQRLNQQTEISLGYWPPPKHAANVPANAAPAPPPATGNLIISLAPINLSASTTPAPATRTNSTQLSASTSSARPSPLPMRSARERALDQAMAKVAAGRVAADGLAEVGVAAEGDKEVELEDVPERLQMAWVADDVPDEVRAQLSLELDAELDVGALLSRVTEAHARAALNQIHSQLTAELGSDEFDLVDPAAATPTFAGTSSDAQAPATTAPYIRAHLHGQQFVRLAIPPTTGRLEFVAEGEVGADREKRLRSFAEKADRDRRLVTDAVQRVKSSTLLDEVDSRAAYLGLSTTRRIPLRNPDLAKFGAHTLGALYVRLPQLSSHFLVLVLNAQGFRFALIAVRDGGDPSQALVIDEIGWLDKAKITGAQGKGKGRQASEGEGVCDATAGFEVTIDELKALHDYSVRRIASFKIESQLHARRIAYRTVIPPVPAGAKGGAGAAAPYLVVRSDDLLRGHVGQRVAWPNLAIRCGVVKVDGEDVVRTTLHARFHDLALVAAPAPQLLPASVAVDFANGIVSLSTDQLDSAVATFLSAFGLVVRAVVMARHRKGAEGEAKGEAAKSVSGAGGVVPPAPVTA